MSRNKYRIIASNLAPICYSAITSYPLVIPPTLGSLSTHNIEAATGHFYLDKPLCSPSGWLMAGGLHYRSTLSLTRPSDLDFSSSNLGILMQASLIDVTQLPIPSSVSSQGSRQRKNPSVSRESRQDACSNSQPLPEDVVALM
ncbi:MAG: hypothetical protein KIT59_11840 [Nitrosomonas sp.]|nr:hypothetical protein [Nitrosomonas sp.]